MKAAGGDFDRLLVTLARDSIHKPVLVVDAP
jgi:hypothetical protein